MRIVKMSLGHADVGRTAQNVGLTAQNVSCTTRNIYT